MPTKTDEVEFIALRAEVKSLGAGESGTGEFEAVLSTASVDREGEVVAPKALDPLPKSIPIYHAHDWRDGAPPVARAVPFYDGDILKCKGVFASTPRAQEIRTLVNEGVVDSMSIGFINGELGVWEGQKALVRAELFESSFTAIPINTEAAVLTSKAISGQKAGKRNAAGDQSHLDAAHDEIVAAGANCTGAKAIRSLKSIVGSVEALQDRIRDALEDAYGDGWGYWGYLRGVNPDPAGGGGIVTFDSSRVCNDHDYATYQQRYADDGALVTLLDEPVEVDIVEVVVPDADADREPVALTKAVEKKPAADKAAAQAAVKSAADNEAAELDLRARAIRSLAATVA